MTQSSTPSDRDSSETSGDPTKPGVNDLYLADPQDSGRWRLPGNAVVLEEISHGRDGGGGFGRKALLSLLTLAAFVVLATVFYAQREIPQTTEDVLARATTSLRAGALRAAIIDFKTVLAAEPERDEVRWKLAQAHHQVGDYANARKEVEGLAGRGFQGEDFSIFHTKLLLDQGEHAAAMSVLDASAFPPRLALPHVLRGEANLGLGRSHVAELDFSRALTLEPDLARARNGKAHIALQRRETTRALRLIGEVLSTDPDNAQANHLQAAAYLMQGRSELAWKSAVAALQAEPRNPFVRLSAVRVALARDDLEVADEHLRWFAEVGYQRADVDHARALVALKRDDLETARRELSIALGRHQSHPASLLTMAALHYTAAEFDQARELLERYLGSEQESSPARQMLAEILLRTDQPTEAIDVLTGSSLDDARSVRLLGEAYAARGDFRSALREFERARDRGANDVELNHRLASGYLWTGATDQAIRELRKADSTRADDLRSVTLLVLARLREDSPGLARDAAVAFVKAHPENALATNLLGGVLQEIGDHAGAREAFNRALELRPELSAAAHNLARLDLRANELDAAVSRYEALLDRNPGDVRAMTGLAGIAARRHQDGYAVTLLEKARALDPRALQARLMLVGRYLQSGHPQDALAVAIEARAVGAGRLEVEIAIGRSQLATGQVGQARVTFEQAVRGFPKSSEAHFRLAEVLLRQSDRAGARVALERTLAIDGDRLDAAGALVTLMLEDKRLEEAATLVGRLRARYPVNGVVEALHGAVLGASGRTSAAADALLVALERRPSVPLLRQTVEALRRAGRDSQVPRLLAAWLDERPQSHEVRLMSALHAHRTGDLEQASQTYEYLLARDYRSALVLNNLAWIRFERGEEGAVDLAREATEVAPDSADYQDTYGWLLGHIGRWADAVPILERAAAVDETDDEKAFHLAVAQAVMRGDEEVARNSRFLTLDADHASHFHATGNVLLARHDRPRAALYALRLALTLDPTNPTLRADVSAANERFKSSLPTKY